MIIIHDKHIAVPKGDSAYFTIVFGGNIPNGGAPFAIILDGDTPEDGTQVLFTVKKNSNARACITKKLKVYGGAASVALKSLDTNKLEPGDYWWDARAIYPNGDVETPAPKQKFTVLDVAGDV